MRQRRVKNLESKYERFEDLIVYDPARKRGSWRELARRAAEGDGAGESGKATVKHLGNLYLEIGCGKGKFISECARRNPDNFYVAVEGHRSVLLRALEKARGAGLTNVAFIPEYVENLCDWFADGEVDGIYLNFSDPLPKNYSAKKRLTHRSRLAQYFEVLSEGGELTFKTDNSDLFNFTIQEIRAADLAILELTRDLHRCEYGEDDIRTEYEYKFTERGENIKRVRVGRRTEGMHRYERSSAMGRGMVAVNGRIIPEEDKLFGVSERAAAAVAARGNDKVIRGTLGALYDDDGQLIVLSSVDEAIKSLSPVEYAGYAPIAGTPGFREAVRRAAFGSYEPKSVTEAVAVPGGTGGIRLAIANYSCPGDRVLTHDWFWTTYRGIADEQGRGLETFRMFNEKGDFDLEDFDYKVKKLLRIQDRLMIILNTPANNPTGYSLSDDDWRGVMRTLNEVPQEKKVCLFVDVAYIDYAGDGEEVRSFLPIIDECEANILPLIGYSASKTFTLYGCRCAALICMARSAETADEFVRACSYSARATWSNSPRGPQEVIARIYGTAELLARVNRERAGYRESLLARGRAFEEAAESVGLEMMPFRGGFFCSVPCEDPETLGRRLEEMDVYLIPFSNGLRVSVAAISEEKCRKLPAMIKEAMQ